MRRGRGASHDDSFSRATTTIGRPSDAREAGEACARGRPAGWIDVWGTPGMAHGNMEAVPCDETPPFKPSHFFSRGEGWMATFLSSVILVFVF